MSINHRIRRRDAEGSDWRRWVRFERVTGDPGQLEGSGFYRMHPLTGEPATIDSIFCALRFRHLAADGVTHRLLASATAIGSSLAVLNMAVTPASRQININGSETNSPPPSIKKFGTGRWSGKLEHDFEYVVAWSIRGSTGDMKCTVLKHSWGRAPLGDNEAQLVADTTLTYPSDSTMSLWNEVLWIFGGNYRAALDCAFFWFHAAIDGSAFVDVETDANQRILAADPTTWTFHTPLVWFQGTAAQWTGSPGNRGSGGAFSYNYAPLDVAA